MVISFLGAVDKRAIVYPLLRVLGHLGKTLVVTDDVLYRVFGGVDNSVMDIDICYASDINYTSANTFLSRDNYQYIVYVLGSDCGVVGDVVFSCTCISKGLDEFVETAQGNGWRALYINYTRLKATESKDVLEWILLDDYRYVFDCESKRRFLSVSSKVVSKQLSSLLGQELGVSVAGILKRTDKTK